jgi:hypothetical protein
MHIGDIDALYSVLEQKERFLFGVKYLGLYAWSFITKKNRADTFFQEECRRQSERLRSLDVGELNL